MLQLKLIEVQHFDVAHKDFHPSFFVLTFYDLLGQNRELLSGALT